jgi:hypothetical protein
MVFHILHFPLESLVQPFFKTSGIIIQLFRMGNTAIGKAQPAGCFFYKTCIGLSRIQEI